MFKQGRYAEINALLLQELDGFDLQGQIECEDLPYWMLVCSVLYNNELKELPNDMLNRKDDLAGKSDRIKNCLKLSNSILKLIEGTQLYKENKYYRQSYFIYNHSTYLVNNDAQGILNMLTQLKQEPKSDESFRIMAHLIPSLSQIKEYDKIIELCEGEHHSPFTFTQVLAFTHYSVGNIEKSCQYFQRYIEDIDGIDESATGNLIVAINLLYRNRNVDTRLLFHNSLQSKVFTREEFKRIIKATCLQFTTNGDNSEVLDLLDFDENSFSSLSDGLKDNVCRLLTSLKEFEKSNKYVTTYLDENKESQSLYLYIKNLYNLKINHDRLLDLLEKWRKQFAPLYEFFACELNILTHLHLYPRIEEVSKYALKFYPDNPDIISNYIQSLYRQENKEEDLAQVLNVDLLNIQFTWQQAILIASICFKSNEHQLGVDLIYPFAKNNPDNATIRQAYFGMLTIQGNKFKRAQHKKVEADTTVRVTYEGAQKIIHINSSTENSKIAKSLLDKTKGDTFTIKESSFGKEVNITVTDILDKYSGLLAEIAEEVSNSFKISGYEMKTITWASNDIEDMKKKLIEEFGADGELRKLTIEDAFKSYYDGKISFTELIRRVDDQKVFEIYDTVTKNNEKGFIIPPLAIFRYYNMNEVKEFVVDFSTLPILSKWDIPGNFKSSFIVSQHLRDFLKDKISEIALLDDSPMTIGISLSGVQPLPYPPNYKKDFTVELNRMLTWVDKYCKVGFAPEKLDLLLNHPEFIDENDWYFKYLIDTSFLANKPSRSLISDDLFYYKNLSHIAKPITLEYFVSLVAPSEREKFVKWFLSNNYIGLTLSQSELKKSFDESPIPNSNNIFQKCIKNLPYYWHKSENVIIEVISLTKYIYTHSFSIDYKLRVIELLFIESLKGYPLNPSSGKLFQQEIHNAFNLLGDAEIQVLQVFKNALRIVSNK